MSSKPDAAARFFDSFAESFDTLYDGRRNVILAHWNSSPVSTGSCESDCPHWLQ